MASLTHNAIKCAVCQHLFFSTLIDPKERAEDLIAKLSRHLEFRHKEDLSRNANATKELAQLVIGHVFLNNMAIIPEDNTSLTGYADELQTEMLKYLGYDPDSDEDEDDSDSEEMLSALIHIKDSCPDTQTRDALESFIESYLTSEESDTATEGTEGEMSIDTPPENLT